MPSLQVATTSNRLAVSAFVEAARLVPLARWEVPRAVGKWSPGQVTEHVALAYEQSRRMLHGTFAAPPAPWFRQLLARWLFLRPLLKREAYGKNASAPDFIQPSESPASSARLLPRFEAAAADLEGDLTDASDAQRTSLEHPVFGRIPLADLLRFLAIHTQHHQPQLSADVVRARSIP